MCPSKTKLKLRFQGGFCGQDVRKIIFLNDFNTELERWKYFS